jgi:hypothetical protein
LRPKRRRGGEHDHGLQREPAPCDPASARKRVDDGEHAAWHAHAEGELRTRQRADETRQARRTAAPPRKLAVADIPSLRRVQCIPDAVADEVDRRNDQDHGDPREDDAPPVEQALVRRRRQDIADARARGLRPAAVEAVDPEADVRQGRLDDDCAGGQDGCRHRDRADGVRNDVLPQDAQVARADSARRLDVLLLTQRECHPADNASDCHPQDAADQHRHLEERVGVQERGGNEDDDERRHGQQQIHDAHYEQVDETAEVAGQGADDQADQRAEETDHERDLELGAKAEQRATEVVPPNLIRPERM